MENEKKKNMKKKTSDPDEQNSDLKCFEKITIFSAKHCQIVCIHHEASDFLLFFRYKANVENAGIRKHTMNFIFEFLQIFQLL